jgi:endonuclease/exonuclease/phosphatase (EEP) superfamily protein YafD
MSMVCFFRRCLVSVSPAQAPLLTYAIDQRETVAYVSASEVDVAQRADFHQSALAALRQRLSQLDWAPVAEHEHTLILAGDLNAVEGLLLPERLQEALALLGATALLACAPKRGVLLVGAYETDDKAGVV